MSTRTAQDILNEQKTINSTFQKLLSKVEKEPNSYIVEEPEETHHCIFNYKKCKNCSAYCKMMPAKPIFKKETTYRCSILEESPYRPRNRPSRRQGSAWNKSIYKIDIISSASKSKSSNLAKYLGNLPVKSEELDEEETTQQETCDLSEVDEAPDSPRNKTHTLKFKHIVSANNSSEDEEILDIFD